MRSTDDEALVAALAAESIVAERTATGVERRRRAAAVGRVAAAHQIILTELRGGDSRGLEEMFLNLTADAAREEVAA